jgi:hypothetical protein
MDIEPRPVDWKDAEFHVGVVPGGGQLVVRGVVERPADVELMEGPPSSNEFWEIQLLARDLPIANEVETPFETSRLVTARENTKGFDLIGASMRKRFHVEPFKGPNG